MESVIVNHFNTLLTGGAAIAARRIHHALLDSGVSSRFWYSKRARTRHKNAGKLRDSYHLTHWPKPNQTIARRYASKAGGLYRRWRMRMRFLKSIYGRDAGYELFSDARRPLPTPCDPRILNSGVLHLHWISKFVDLTTFFASIPDDFPIVWTLHDMWAMTGGCHYTAGCEAFLTHCGNCPQLGRPAEDDLAAISFQIKRAAIAGKNIHVVSNSRWLGRQAAKSPILADLKSFQTIHYGLDTKVFAPMKKLAARKVFSLPPDAKIIAFGAEDVAASRKGVVQLQRALTRFHGDRNVLVVVFGRGKIPHSDLPLPETRNVGYLADEGQQAALYSAADLFVIPSLEEAFGLTGIEAMACGTPVIGFDTGGIPDFIKPNETGLLAAVGDAQNLGEQMQWLLDRPEVRHAMGTGARRLVETEFEQTRQAGKYIQLYEAIWNEWQDRRDSITNDSVPSQGLTTPIDRRVA